MVGAGCRVLLRHDLNKESPAGEVPFFDALVEVALVTLPILTDKLLSLLVGQILYPLLGLEVELDPEPLVPGVHKAEGVAAKAVQSNGERWLGPLLIIIGILMLDFIRIPGSSGKLIQHTADRIKPGKGWSSLLLGMIFALAFCPYCGVLYFGMLMPMVLLKSGGLLLLPDFAIATGLPVLFLAWILAFSIGGIGRFYKRVKSIEFWLRRSVAVIFILTSLYFLRIFYF